MKLLFYLGGVFAVTACAFGQFIPTRPANDVNVSNIVSLLTTSGGHIRSQGTYAGFAVRLGSNVGNDVGAVLYNNKGSNISTVTLTSGIYTNLGLQSDVAMTGTNFIIAGGSPLGLPGSIYEFGLGSEIPLPASFSLITNFTVGDVQAQRCVAVKHSGGGIAVFFSSNSNALWTCWRTNSGGWTNFGSIPIPGVPNSTTFLTAAEMPTDHSIWVWFNNDASGFISAAQFVTNAAGLILSQQTSFVDTTTTNGQFVWGQQAPYGELNNPMEAISDTSSNRIILGYENDLFTESDTDYNSRVVPIVLVGMTSNTNHYVYGVSSNNVIRLGGLLGITKVGKSVTLTCQADYTNYDSTVSSPLAAFPIFFQQIADGIEYPPQFAWSNWTYNSYFAYKNDSLDFVGRYADQSWHLLIFGSQYYVDPASGSDSNDGLSQGTAWAHIPGAIGFTGTGWAQLNNGDTLTVKGGSSNLYSVQLTTPGYTANFPGYNGSAAFDSIIIQSGDLIGWGTGKAILDEQGSRTFGIAFGQGSGSALQGITLDGFEIRNIAAGDAPPPFGPTGSSCILLGSGGNNQVSYITIKRCWLHDALRTVNNTGHGIEGANADHTLIYYNQIGQNIGTKGIEPFFCQQGVISNNFVWDFGDHGIALSGTTNFDVCCNLIMPWTNSAHTGAYGIGCASGKYNDVWNNIIFQGQGKLSNKMGIGVYAPLGALAYADRFYFNTLSFLNDPVDGGSGNAIAWGNDVGPTTNIVYQNNIVYKCTNAFGPSGFFYYSSYATNCTISFSDFFANTSSDTVAGKQTGGVTTTYTVAGFVPDSGMTYSNDVQLEPSFIGGTLPNGINGAYQPNQGYFALTTLTPPAIRGTGNALAGDATHGYNHAAGKFNLDIIGTTRANWSMGAYEWASPPASATNASVVITGNTTINGNVLIK